MIDVPVDIISINCVNPEDSLKALNYSCKKINFKSSFLFTDKNIQNSSHNIVKINKLNSINEYNDFCLKLSKFEFESDHILLIQDDGFVINPQNWKNEFLKYDYIGAPWPDDEIWLNKFVEPEIKEVVSNSFKKNRIGNGGFSLRSKKYLNFCETFNSCNRLGEDIFLNVINFEKATQHDILYPDVNLALKFSTEFGLFGKDKQKWLRYKYMKNIKSFGFHGKMNKKEIALKF